VSIPITAGSGDVSANAAPPKQLTVLTIVVQFGPEQYCFSAAT
jgi:hypothetical protein